VFSHCDLLNGNVIITPPEDLKSTTAGVADVNFIDYEYATAAPAAFDIANHFSEWGGFECNYDLYPSKSQRREFIHDYLHSYHLNHGYTAEKEGEVDVMFKEVDLFRGLPSFYWGIWALIQTEISQIDFDYASYAEIRLAEYWAWREVKEGSRAKEGKEIHLREKAWAKE
jgi:ethanolamine kinase